ncbi:MAG: serine/threonine protein kinase [Rubripirellula sp.]|nr:serine/threonine protein kinase [Rubripirellula sp.]
MRFAHNAGSRPLPRYVIKGGLGIGGFGEVYLAESNAGKKVALKLIQRNLEIELRGAKNCLNIKHPNLLSLYDICEDELGNSWLVMEYVEGLNLRQVFQKQSASMHASEVHRWVIGLIEGLKHLHRGGIVHRDIKPENIFDDHGIIKLGDYGLSTVIQPNGTRQTEGVGTVHYMAPEVGRGEYGASVDVYAVGIVLYELITGDVPFDGETKNEIILKHLTADPNLELLPLAFRQIVSKCLLKDPNSRYEDLSELIKDLNYAFADQNATEIVVAELVDDTTSGCDAKSPSLDIASNLNQAPHFNTAMSPGQIQSSKVSLKYCLVIFLMIGMLIHPWVFMPLTFLLTLAYVPVLIVQKLLASHGIEGGVNGDSQHGRKVFKGGSRQWRSELRAGLAKKSFLIRFRDWLFSSAFAVPFAGAIVLIVTAVLNADQSFHLSTHASMVWSATLAGLASICLMAVSQKWEVEEEHDFSNRFVLASVGAVVGIVAFSLHQYILLGTELGRIRDVAATELPTWIYKNQSPTLLAYCSHFALLFFVVRWCRLADPLRERKVSVWFVLVPVIAEWSIQQLFPIAQPAGMVFSGCLAVVVQVASPWLTASQRDHLVTVNRGNEIGALH